MAAGSIVVDLLMKTGTFETDTQRAGKALKKLQKDAEAVGKAIGLAFTGAVVGLAYMVKSSIDAQDHLNDLAKKTGIAADTLGGIGFAAQQSGLDIDSVATAAGKLNKSLAEAAAGNVQAAEAFNVLGVNVKDAAGQTKNADVVLAELADKFATYKDGPEKAALALRIFGKAGADIIPLLDEGGKALQDQIAYFKRYSGVTVETAQKADAFKDTLTKLELLSGAFGKTLTAELLPSLQGLANLFVENKEKGDQFKGVAGDIATFIKAIAVGAAYATLTFTTFGDQIGAVLAKAGALARLDFKGFANIGKDADENLAAARKRFEDFRKAINGEAVAGQAAPAAKPAQVQAPRLTGTGPGTDTAEAQLKKQLEGLLRTIRNATDQEQSVLAFSNRFLEGEYQDGVISLANFFGDQKNIRAHALASLVSEQDKIIAAEADFAKKTTNPASRIDAENKIADAVFKREQAIIRAGQEEQLAIQQNARDLIALQKAYEGVNAQVLDLAENFAAAAAVKFNLQNDALSKTFTANGNAAGLTALATLRAASIAQAAFQKASLDAGRTLDSLSNAEERIALAQQTGALGSLQALSKIGELRKAQIPVLEAQVQAEEAIARASGNQTLIRNAEAARLALDKLKASADPLAESLNRTFGDDFNTALDDFVTSTKNAADAFKSFAKSVLNDILKLGSKSITESIFGGSGGAGGFISDLFKGQNTGGLVDIFKSAVGGSSGSAVGAVADTGATAAKAAETAAATESAAALTVLGTSGGATAVAFDATALSVTTLATAAASAAAALAAVAATSTASSSSSLVAGFASVAGISGGRAEGGPVLAGQSYLVGERGPEVLRMGSTSGNVTPNRALGGTTQNIVVNVQGQPGQTRDALLNQGVTIGQGIQKAMARNA